MAGTTCIEYEYVRSKSGKEYPFVGYLVNEFVGVMCSMPIGLPKEEKEEFELSNGLEEVLSSADDFNTVSKKLRDKLDSLYNL